jgi:hypothetical protein
LFLVLFLLPDVREVLLFPRRLRILPGGDLYFHLARITQGGAEGFPETEAKVLLAEISLGVQHMHQHHFLHNDLKLENIMLTRRGHVKLIDFGLARAFKGFIEEATPTGSLLYMPPELLQFRIGGPFRDWWAVGVVAHELLTGRSPWSSLTDKRTIRDEIRSYSPVVAPPKLSRPARCFVEQLLHKDYRLRLGSASPNDVLSAHFFMGIDWAATVKGHAAPAFVPMKPAQRSCGMSGEQRCVLSGEQRAALRVYLKHVGKKRPTAEDGAWSLAMETVDHEPQHCAPEQM